MAIDFQSVRKQISEMGERAPARAREFNDKKRAAADLLTGNAINLEMLGQRVQAALAFNANLRSAVPGSEPLDAQFPLPEMPEKAALLAADGSQIYPDRHGPSPFSLINVGAICMLLGKTVPPSQTVTSALLYDDEMYTDNGLITESLVALMRDLGERELLAELAAGLQAPILTLTDGPLELWEPREESGDTYRKKFDEYIAALRKLYKVGASTAGYIDKPGSDLLVRLLEIASLSLEDLKLAGKQRPFIRLTDVDLLESILGPFERSAIFGIQSKNAVRYTDELAIHFFYLNVGKTASGLPYLARVEIPAWVAGDSEMVDTLHAVLVQQCRVLGTRPFPYLLHRSHEVAVVTLDEKKQVEDMIAMELHKQGVYTGTQSYKSSVKEVGGRSRFSNRR